MKKRIRNRKGFTLIELVVVIAILGILAAIAVPRLLGFQERAKSQADNQVAAQVRNAVSLLYANRELVTSGDVVFYLDNTPATPGIHNESSVIDSVTGSVSAPTTANGLRDLIASATSGALIKDYKLQNTSGRFIWVKVTSDGSVQAVLSQSKPTFDN